MLRRLTTRRGMNSRKTFVHSLTRPQLLWTDPQDTPGRGPSKRVCGWAGLLSHVVSACSRVLVLRSDQMSLNGGATSMVSPVSFAVTKCERVSRFIVRRSRRAQYVLDGFAIEHDGLCTTVSLHSPIQCADTHYYSRSSPHPTTSIR